MKCSRCNKVKPTTGVLYTGANGFRVYQLCAECKAKVEKQEREVTHG